MHPTALRWRRRSVEEESARSRGQAIRRGGLPSEEEVVGKRRRRELEGAGALVDRFTRELTTWAYREQ
jgi:hypothetical protein